MTQLDTDLRQVATDLIGELGKVVTLRRQIGGTYSSATQTVTGASDDDQTVTIAPPFQYDDDKIDGSRIQREDFRTMLAAQDIILTWAPEVGHRIQLDGSGPWYEIKSIIPHYSGDLIAAYELQLRRLVSGGV